MEQIQEFITTEQVDAFIGDSLKSTTTVWLREQLKNHEAAVHEFIILALENGFKTIGHLFAQRKESAMFLSSFAAEGRIEISQQEVPCILLGDLMRKLEYAFAYRESKLMNVLVKNTSNESSGSQISQAEIDKLNAFTFTDVNSFVHGLCVAKNKQGEFYYKNRGLPEPQESSDN